MRSPARHYYPPVHGEVKTNMLIRRDHQQQLGSFVYLVSRCKTPIAAMIKMTRIYPSRCFAGGVESHKTHMLRMFRPRLGVLRAPVVSLALILPLRFKTRMLTTFRPNPGVLRAAVVNLAQTPNLPSFCRPALLGDSPLSPIHLPLLSLNGKLFPINGPRNLP